MAGPIRISILANANQAISTFNRTGTAAKGLGSKVGAVGGVLRTALVGVGVYKGIEALTSRFKDANEAVQLQEKLAAQTKAAIASTGGAANVSAGQVVKLSDALEKKSLIDAEQIQSAQNMLLTFTNVRNEAGRGNAIFTRATQTITDMATALGSDATGEAQRLGRALNDPIKGVTALSKVGVTFTDSQREQIKTLTESGQRMKAQKLILGELSKEFGGSAAAAAKTSAGSFKRLNDAIDGVFEGIVAKALPVLANVADYLTTNVPKAVAAAQPTIDKLRSAFGALADKLQPVGDWLRENPVVIKGAAAALGIAAGAALVAAAAMGALAVATSPITLTVLAIAGVGAAAAYAYKNSETFRNGVQAIGTALQTKVVPAVQAAGRWFTGTLVPAVVRTGKAVATNLRPVLDQLGQTFQQKIRPAVAQVVAKFVEWSPTIKRVAGFVVQLYGKLITFQAAVIGKVVPVLIRVAGTIISTVVPAVVGFIDKAIAIGKAVGNAAADVARFARAVVDKVTNVVTTIAGMPGRVKGAVAGAIGWLVQTGRDIVQGLLNGIDELIHKVTEKISSLKSTITNGLKDLPGKLNPFGRVTARSYLAGLTAGVTEGSAGVTAVFERVTKLVDTTFDNQLKATTKRLKDRLKGAKLDQALAAAEKASAAARRAALKSLTNERAALAANAKAQDRIAAALARARDNAKAARQAFDDYATSVRDSVNATGNVTTLGQNEDGTVSAASLIDQLKDKVVRAQRYAALIAQLTGKLNSTALQQIIDAGVDGGLATAEAIAAGGSGAIAQVNKLQAQLNAQAAKLGQSTAQTFKGAGVAAADAIVAGLETDAAKLDKAAQRLANRLVKAIRAALGAKAVQAAANGRTTTVVARSMTPAIDVYTSRTAAAATPQTLHLTIELTGDAQDAVARGKRYIKDIDVALDKGARTQHIVVKR